METEGKAGHTSAGSAVMYAAQAVKACDRFKKQRRQTPDTALLYLPYPVGGGISDEHPRQGAVALSRDRISDDHFHRTISLPMF